MVQSMTTIHSSPEVGPYLDMHTISTASTASPDKDIKFVKRLSSKEKAIMTHSKADDIVNQIFHFSIEDLDALSTEMIGQMEQGLQNHDQMIQMLSAYVTDFPTGNEVGEYLTLDLGGTNLRILHIALQGNGKHVAKSLKAPVSQEAMTGTADLLFREIAEKVAQLVKQENMMESEKKIPLGFTFSFPTRQTALNSGTLVKWNKGYNASGCVGEDVVALLQKQLDELNLPVVCKALVNDTTGTLMASSYEHKGQCKAGIIVGTGCNGCYIEKSASITKENLVDDIRDKNMIINTEIGNFTGKTLKRCIIDEILDNASNNPTHQHLEKCISGHYLGKLTALTIFHLHKNGLCFRSYEGDTLETDTNLAQLKSVDMATIQEIHNTDTDDTLHHSAHVVELATCARQVLREFLATNYNVKESYITDQDTDIVFHVVDAVSWRSAKIASAIIFALIRRMSTIGIIQKDNEKTLIAVDGTVYKSYPFFKQRMDRIIKALRHMRDIRNDIQVLPACQDGSGVGSVAVLASLESTIS